LPIVFLTSHTEKEYVDRVRDITSYGYVIKRSGEFVLIESIRMALQLFDAHNEIATKEEHLAHIVDEAPVGLFNARSDGTLERVNPEVARILGFSSIAEVIEHYQDISTQLFRRPERWRELLQALREDGVVRDFRIEAIRGSGETAYLKLNARSFADAGNSPMRMSGFVVDETSQRKTEQDLRQSNWERDSIIALTQELIVRLDQNERWTFVNDRACEFFGKSREELIGQHFMDYVHPEDAAAVRSEEEQMATLHDSITGSVNRQWTPRGWRTVRWNSAPILDDSGRYVGHQSTGRDITAEVQFKDELESQNAAQRLLLDTMDAQAWFLVDEETYGLANRAHAEFMGLGIEDIEYKKLTDILPEDVAAVCRHNNARAFESGVPLQSEERVLDDHGKERILSITRTPKLNAEGSVEYVVCVGTDVTDQRRREQQLTEERQRLATIIQATGVGTWEWNALTGEARFNERWATMLGYTLEELSPVSIETWRNLSHPEDLERSNHLLEEHFNGQSPMYQCEVRVRHKDGSWVWILDTGSVVEWTEEGSPLRVYGTHQDISEQKQLQEALEHKNRELNLILDSSPLMIFYKDASGRYIFANAALANTLGLPKEQIRGKRSSDIFPAAQAQAMEERDRYVLTTGDAQLNVEEQYTAEGTTRLASTSRVPIQDSDGRTSGVVGFVEDITERKKVEDELRRASERHEQAERSAQLGHWEMDIATGESVWSDEFFRICGYEPQCFSPTAEMGLRIIHPDDRDRAERHVNEAVEAGEAYSLDKRIVRPSGEIRWVHSRGEVVYDDKRRPAKLVGSFLDITERKRAEEKLQAALEEKDQLMRELNHRVKNNLAMVVSLVHLKQAAVGDETDLSDITNQVNTIRSVHEKLQNAEDVSRVEVAPYFTDVVHSVISSRVGADVELEIGIGDITLPTKTATTLGLIISELATNAVKHGFRPESRKRFAVSMETVKNSGEYVLIVSNTGREFPESIDLQNTTSLGLQLVTALTGQLGGEVELQRTPTPVFTIRFPIPE